MKRRIGRILRVLNGREHTRSEHLAAVEALDCYLAQLQRQGDALKHIASQQQRALAVIEANGFVFTDIGVEPGNWQHLAFSLYSDICEIGVIAQGALEEK